MQPIPETIELAQELGRYNPNFDVLQHLQTTADRVQDVVPECVGLSIAWLDQGVAFTLVASDSEIAVLDAVQYLDGGPCTETVERGTGRHWGQGGQGGRERRDDPLSEEGWQLFAQATAARAVKSSLTLPLSHGGRIVGTANLYAASDNAFGGHVETLADIVGGSAREVVRNADLTFATRRVAEQSLESLRANDVVKNAVGILAAKLQIDVARAEQRLADSAARAGITVEQFARALVSMYS